MTLRLRLVAALVVLLTVGLAIFGVATYGFYARSQYDELDRELKDLQSRSAMDLRRQVSGTGDFDERDRAPGHFPAHYGLYFAGLWDSTTGTWVENGTIEPDDRDDLPDLPDDLALRGEPYRWLDVGSVDGDTEWRVLISDEDDYPGGNPAWVVVTALPQTQVQDSLRKLAAVELVAALVLLVAVALGAWLVLRRGLRPLERMAATASTITAGQLGTRVELADERSEVGQLGLALNTMLGRIEDAFSEQEATEHRLRQFLADASHELRTPLTSIQGFAELFRLGADANEADVAVSMQRIEEEAGRMRVLVDDLLLLARLDQTRPIERVPVDLAVVAADACSAAVAVEPDRRVTLDAPAPVVVRGDDDHLRQAVTNLVANAVRHTPAGSPIEVSAVLVGGDAVVRVRDHGTGLDDEALAHAFDRFWQGDSSRAEAGAGLGLSIVAAIAEEHGGSASAVNAEGSGDDSTGEVGAIFTLRLPTS
jgi:two-component system OmpR family sensor kinase